eukprot:gene3956-4943_t
MKVDDKKIQVEKDLSIDSKQVENMESEVEEIVEENCETRDLDEAQSQNETMDEYVNRQPDLYREALVEGLGLKYVSERLEDLSIDEWKYYRFLDRSPILKPGFEEGFHGTAHTSVSSIVDHGLIAYGNGIYFVHARNPTYINNDGIKKVDYSKDIEIIGSLFTEVRLLVIHPNDSKVYKHLSHPSCIIKNTRSLSTSFAYFDGFLDEFHVDLLSNGIMLPIDMPESTAEENKVTNPLSNLTSLSIKGPAGKVKKEKVATKMLITDNASTLEHFEMLTHKQTLVKTIFDNLESCTSLTSLGIGFVYGPKCHQSLDHYFSLPQAELLRELLLSFESKMPVDEVQIVGLLNKPSLKNLESLTLGHKKLSGPEYESHSYGFPATQPKLLFDTLVGMTNLKKLIMYHDSGSVGGAYNFSVELAKYLKDNETLTSLRCPFQGDGDLTKVLSEMENLKHLVVSFSGGKVKFHKNLRSIEIFDTPVQTIADFFRENIDSHLHTIKIRDYIQFDLVENYIKTNTHLENFQVSLKGKHQYEHGRNPFTSIGSNTSLKKLSVIFAKHEKHDVNDIINRMFRWLDQNQTITYFKFTAHGYDLENLTTYQYRFLNKYDRYDYFVRSLPIPTDPIPNLEVWDGSEEKKEKLTKLVIETKTLVKELEDICKERPEYNVTYILDYVKESAKKYNKTQWEKSDNILK